MIRAVILALCFSLFAITAGAVETLPAKSGKGPVEVTADHLEADQQAQMAVFSGEVVAKHDEMTLYAERLVLHYLGDGKEIDRLVATGSVRVVQLDRVATSEKAILYQLEEKIVLTGGAEVHQGQNLVSGDEITLFLKDNRSLVKSGKDGRVKAVFFPEKKQQ